MNIPFTTEQFFEVFARYNDSVWPMQVILYLLALAAVALLVRPGSMQSRMISAVLAFLWAWMAIAYQFAFFTEINPASWLFGMLFALGALLFGRVGILKGKLQFRRGDRTRLWVGSSLIAFGLVVYPLLGYSFGQRYPRVPTFGLPCPTTIFTIGLLLFLNPPVPKSVFLVPLIWAAVGSIAAIQLGVFQDLGLLVAGLVGLSSVISCLQKANPRCDTGALQVSRR